MEDVCLLLQDLTEWSTSSAFRRTQGNALAGVTAARDFEGDTDAGDYSSTCCDCLVSHCGVQRVEGLDAIRRACVAAKKRTDREAGNAAS
jgi:hypothetical protein